MLFSLTIPMSAKHGRSIMPCCPTRTCRTNPDLRSGPTSATDWRAMSKTMGGTPISTADLLRTYAPDSVRRRQHLFWLKADLDLEDARAERERRDAATLPPAKPPPSGGDSE